MASTRIRFDLEWENGVSIMLTRRENDDDGIVIVEMEENGCMATIAESFIDISKKTFGVALKRATDEMIAS